MFCNGHFRFLQKNGLNWIAQFMSVHIAQHRPKRSMTSTCVSHLVRNYSKRYSTKQCCFNQWRVLEIFTGCVLIHLKPVFQKYRKLPYFCSANRNVRDYPLDRGQNMSRKQNQNQLTTEHKSRFFRVCTRQLRLLGKWVYGGRCDWLAILEEEVEC